VDVLGVECGEEQFHEGAKNGSFARSEAKYSFGTLVFGQSRCGDDGLAHMILISGSLF